MLSTQKKNFRRHHNTQHKDTQYNDTQYNNTQYNDTQYNDTQYNNTQYNDTQFNDIQYNNTRITTLSSMFEERFRSRLVSMSRLVCLWQTIEKTGSLLQNLALFCKLRIHNV